MGDLAWLIQLNTHGDFDIENLIHALQKAKLITIKSYMMSDASFQEDDTTTNKGEINE